MQARAWSVVALALASAAVAQSAETCVGAPLVAFCWATPSGNPRGCRELNLLSKLKVEKGSKMTVGGAVGVGGVMDGVLTDHTWYHRRDKFPSHNARVL